MNRPVWLARLLSFGGVLETVSGLGLLLDPAGGAGLLSLGLACWLARNTPTSPAGVGVTWAHLAYNVVTCVTLAWAGVALGMG